MDKVLLRNGSSSTDLADKRSMKVSLLIGHHLGNWSSTQEKANQISQMTEVSHSPKALSTGCVTRYWKKKARMMRRMMITNLYDVSWVFGIGITLESGCEASTDLHCLVSLHTHTHTNICQKLSLVIMLTEGSPPSAAQVECLKPFYPVSELCSSCSSCLSSFPPDSSISDFQSHPCILQYKRRAESDHIFNTISR